MSDTTITVSSSPKLWLSIIGTVAALLSSAILGTWVLSASIQQTREVLMASMYEVQGQVAAMQLDVAQHRATWESVYQLREDVQTIDRRVIVIEQILPRISAP